MRFDDFKPRGASSMETPSREVSDAGSAARRNPRSPGVSLGRGLDSFLDDLTPEATRQATTEDRAALLQLTKFRERLAAMGDGAGDGDEHDPPATPSDSPRTMDTTSRASSPPSPDENAPPGTGIPGMTPRKVHPSFTLPPHEQQRRDAAAAAAVRTRGTSPSLITSPSGRIEVGATATTTARSSPLGREPTTPTDLDDAGGSQRRRRARVLEDGTDVFGRDDDDVFGRDNDDGDGLTETHGSAAADPTARPPADDPRSLVTRSNDDPRIVGRLLGSVEAALAEAVTPRAALGALRADVDECRAAIDALRESHVALEREDGALTEAQGQMREELDDAWRTRLPRLERLMFRLADRLDRVVDEAVAASEAVNVRRLEEELGRLRVEIAETIASIGDGKGEAVGEATLEAIAHVDSSVNALRAETAAAVESVRVETLARLERMEAAQLAEEARRKSAVESAVESTRGSRHWSSFAAGLEPCVDVITALAARVLGPGRRSGKDERESYPAVTATGSALDDEASGVINRGLRRQIHRCKTIGGIEGVAWDDDAGADLLGASLVVLAAEAAHAIAPRGPCRVATRVVRAAVWTSTAALASGAVKSWCHRVANEAMAERRRRLEGGAKEGDDDDDEDERFETPPARSSADPELFVNTH